MELISRAFLDDKAKAINHLRGQMAENVIEIGRNLSEARDLCEHGLWLKWLQDNIEFTDRQAQSYIRVFNKFGNTKSASHLGIEKLKLLAQLPDDLPAEDFAEKHDIENTSIRDLKQLIKAEITLPDAEKKQIAEQAYAKGVQDSNSQIGKELDRKNESLTIITDKQVKLSSELSSLKTTIKDKEIQIKDLIRQVGDARRVDQLQADITKLKSTRETFQRELDEIGDLVRIKSGVEEVLKKISPVKYMSHFNKESMSPVALGILRDLVGEIDAWMKDVRDIIDGKNIVIEVSHE